MFKKLALLFFLAITLLSLFLLISPQTAQAVCLPQNVTKSNCDPDIYNCSNNIQTFSGDNLAACENLGACGDVIANFAPPPDYQTVCFAKKGQSQTQPKTCGTLGYNCCPAPDLCNSGLQPSGGGTVGGACICEDPADPIPEPNNTPQDINDLTNFVVENNEKPFPKIWLPCNKERGVEFHSLRPYQAAPCGEANKALYCSNDLIFIESFEMRDKKDCTMGLTGPGERTFTCHPDHHVYPHTLYVKLDDSDFPIMGNTEDVKNSRDSTETLDDAAKVNEYVSWYLSGVNTRAEYETPSESQVVNFSGPVQKLLPSIIADSYRSTVIKNVLDNKLTNHNQTVVCATKPVQLLPSWLTNIFGIGAVGIGTAKAVPCYDGGGSIYKLKNWDQSFISVAIDSIRPYLSKMLSANYATSFVNSALVDRWSKKTPPLPWDDGTGKPFVTSDKYQKAYNEWRGDLCAFLPNPLSGKEYLACVKIPGVTNNEFADLFQYVPLAETPDKAGSESIIGVSIDPDGGTKVNVVNWGKKVDPPLFFAHTEEVKQLSETLNKTYTPKDVQSVPVPESTEKNVCSVVNVRTNAGDNLFPGDEDELQLQNVEYYITEATCHEVWTRSCHEDEFGHEECTDNHTIECPADVTITIKTNTMTPSANEIFTSTVADSMSTFRRIYPKVEAGAPVSCIADIPTVTDVKYNPLINKSPGSQSPNEGSLSFKVDNNPSDGGNATPQLTFPHIGSVYEYFLKGIQTALRPKGYADPSPISGKCTPTKACNDWESRLVENGGACGACNTGLGPLAEKILASAGAEFGVPASNIYAAMKHEGIDWAVFQGQFTDENVRKWSTPVECGGEPMPSCDNDAEVTQPPFGFLKGWFYKGDGTSAVWTAVQRLDPLRNSPEKVSRCNFLDAAYAAAKSLRQGSSMTVSGTSCGSYSFNSTQPSSCSAWTDAKVAQSQVAYSGQCANNPKYETVPYKIEDVVAWENAAKCQ